MIPVDLAALAVTLLVLSLYYGREIKIGYPVADLEPPSSVIRDHAGAVTMVGYRRVVRTLGEKLGRRRVTPGQGASAEVVGSVLIGAAGFTGLPVSTTHIITSGIAGTMIAGGQGVQPAMLVRIALAWIFTLPVTMLLAGSLFYLLSNPGL